MQLYPCLYMIKDSYFSEFFLILKFQINAFYFFVFCSFFYIKIVFVVDEYDFALFYFWRLRDKSR